MSNLTVRPYNADGTMTSLSRKFDLVAAWGHESFNKIFKITIIWGYNI
jgi:hypothetical protein